MNEQLTDAEHLRRIDEVKRDRPVEVDELPASGRDGDEVYYDDGEGGGVRLYHYYTRGG